jgi:phosphoglycerate kinase
LSHPFTVIIGGLKAETKIPVIKNYLDKADNILVGGKLVSDPLMDQFNDTKIIKAKLTPDSFDITDSSIVEFIKVIKSSKQILWAGPIGYFEKDAYSHGTKSIIDALSEATSNGAITLVAGGETIEAVNKFGAYDKMSYISLAGGATLDYLSGKTLPALEKLKY